MHLSISIEIWECQEFHEFPLISHWFFPSKIHPIPKKWGRGLIQEATDGPLAAQKVAAHFFKELSGREAPGNWAKLYDEWAMSRLCLGYIWYLLGVKPSSLLWNTNEQHVISSITLQKMWCSGAMLIMLNCYRGITHDNPVLRLRGI